MSHLKQMLDAINVTYHERMFESEDGIAGFGSEPFVSDYKTLPYHALICLVCFLIWSYYLIQRMPTTEYTSLQLMLYMQDHCSLRQLHLLTSQSMKPVYMFPTCPAHRQAHRTFITLVTLSNFAP